MMFTPTQHDVSNSMQYVKHDLISEDYKRECQLNTMLLLDDMKTEKDVLSPRERIHVFREYHHDEISP